MGHSVEVYRALRSKKDVDCDMSLLTFQKHFSYLLFVISTELSSD
jgi:hypothetical protein